jgi:beta-lactamase class A
VTATAALGVLLLVLVIDGKAHLRIPGLSHGSSAGGGSAQGAGSGPAGSRRSSTAGKGTRRHLMRLSDPLSAPAMHSFLASRKGSVSAAVEDLRTGQTWVYHPWERAATASIMKVDILETLLHEDQLRGERLSPSTAETAEGMIEESDNGDAQDLWELEGGASAVAAYNANAGLTQTAPNTAGYWGLSTTSALDQVRLLRELVLPQELLDQASQIYQLNLMHHVESDQDWGVSGGVPASADIALKNGWLPLSDDYYNWEINSIGRIKGDGRRYLIAVLTAHDPGEEYGIDTIERMASIVWRQLAPRYG